jgi:hypothetical protein
MDDLKSKISDARKAGYGDDEIVQFLAQMPDVGAKVNEALKHVKNTGGTPQNKWDYGKLREMHENNITEAMKRLESHKAQISEFEAKCRLSGVDETEIQKGVYQSFSHQHIQLLEAVISAKKTLAMMDIGTVEELTRQKIAILEELTLQKISILEEMV